MCVSGERGGAIDTVAPAGGIQGAENEYFQIKRFGFLRSNNFIFLNQIEIQ